MFWLAHLAAGLLIGKLSGNYLVAILVSLGVDLDHLFPYARNGLLHPGKFWRYVTGKEKELDKKPYILHSVFFFVPISALVLVLHFSIGMVFAVSYCMHLLMDFLSTSKKQPFYPFGFSIRGPVGYCSREEFVITGLVFAVFGLL